MAINGGTAVRETTSLFRRARAAAACWRVLLTARLLRRSSEDAHLERCLQFKKGTKFRLSGGEIHFLGEKDGRRMNANETEWAERT